MSEQAVDPYSKEGVRVAYDAACAERDAIEARVAPLRAKARAAADESEKFRVKAMDAHAELVAARGGNASWFALKKRIGTLAKLLGGK